MNQSCFPLGTLNFNMWKSIRQQYQSNFCTNETFRTNFKFTNSFETVGKHNFEVVCCKMILNEFSSLHSQFSTYQIRPFMMHVDHIDNEVLCSEWVTRKWNEKTHSVTTTQSNFVNSTRVLSERSRWMHSFECIWLIRMFSAQFCETFT